MKLKQRGRKLAHFFAGYSLLGSCILLVLVLGFHVKLSDIWFLALHGGLFLNISCIYMLASFVAFTIAVVVQLSLTIKMYYQMRDGSPRFIAFLMELMYVFQTLCWKPYKGLDIRWVFQLPKCSAHDRKIYVRRWIPLFVETVLWWGITAAVFYTILIPGNNEISLRITQVTNVQRLIIFGVSLAIVILASILFGFLYHLFDRIRVDILDRNREKRLSNRRSRKGFIPAGCTACGGPYPLCKDGCPIFDDE